MNRLDTLVLLQHKLPNPKMIDKLELDFVFSYSAIGRFTIATTVNISSIAYINENLFLLLSYSEIFFESINDAEPNSKKKKKN